MQFLLVSPDAAGTPKGSSPQVMREIPSGALPVAGSGPQPRSPRLCCAQSYTRVLPLLHTCSGKRGTHTDRDRVRSGEMEGMNPLITRKISPQPAAPVLEVRSEPYRGAPPAVMHFLHFQAPANEEGKKLSRADIPVPSRFTTGTSERFTPLGPPDSAWPQRTPQNLSGRSSPSPGRYRL